MTKIDKNQLLLMREQRFSQAKIAKLFNCSRAAVSKQVKKLEKRETKNKLAELIDHWDSRNTYEKDRGILKASVEELRDLRNNMVSIFTDMMYCHKESVGDIKHAKSALHFIKVATPLWRQMNANDAMWHMILTLYDMNNVIHSIFDQMSIREHKQFQMLSELKMQSYVNRIDRSFSGFKNRGKPPKGDRYGT
jgi:predicted transcriptional regulator